MSPHPTHHLHLTATRTLKYAALAQGFAGLTEKLARGTTVWGAAHLPQNRDVFAAHAGDGGVSLFRYRYPDQRKIKVRVRLDCFSYEEGPPGLLVGGRLWV